MCENENRLNHITYVSQGGCVKEKILGGGLVESNCQVIALFGTGLPVVL